MGMMKKIKNSLGIKKKQTAENIGLPYNVRLPDSMSNLQEAIDELNKPKENVDKVSEVGSKTEPVRVESKITEAPVKKSEPERDPYENAIDKEIAKKSYYDLEKEFKEKMDKKDNVKKNDKGFDL